MRIFSLFLTHEYVLFKTTGLGEQYIGYHNRSINSLVNMELNRLCMSAFVLLK